MNVKPSIAFLTSSNDPILLSTCATIAAALVGNPHFPTPDPTLTVPKAAVADFSAALQAAAKGGTEQVSLKNQKRATLVAPSRRLSSYLSLTCDGDMAKLVSSKFPHQKTDRTSAPRNRPGDPKFRRFWFDDGDGFGFKERPAGSTLRPYFTAGSLNIPAPMSMRPDAAADPASLPTPTASLPGPSRLADWRVFAAAGAASLAAVSHADADIIYGNMNLFTSVFGSQGRNATHLPFFLGGNNPQTAFVQHTAPQFGEQCIAGLKNSAGNIIGFSAGAQSVRRFTMGQAIPANAGRGNGAASILQVGVHNNGVHGTRQSATAHGGQFANGVTGFVGFRALKSGTAKFYKSKSTYVGSTFTRVRYVTKSAKFKPGDLGWIRVEVGDNKGYPTTLKLIDYAFNDVPGATITAGQTMPAAVPEPSSKALALLALGAGGVIAWRKARRDHGLPATTGPVETPAA